MNRIFSISFGVVGVVLPLIFLLVIAVAPVFVNSQNIQGFSACKSLSAYCLTDLPDHCTPKKNSCEKSSTPVYTPFLNNIFNPDNREMVQEDLPEIRLVDGWEQNIEPILWLMLMMPTEPQETKEPAFFLPQSPLKSGDQSETKEKEDLS